MPRDKNGTALAPGDEVTIRARVVSVADNEEYGNLTLETVEPMYPAKNATGLYLNTRQVEIVTTTTTKSINTTATPSSSPPPAQEPAPVPAAAPAPAPATTVVAGEIEPVKQASAEVADAHFASVNAVAAEPAPAVAETPPAAAKS
jgi:hypothetical protein